MKKNRLYSVLCFSETTRIETVRYNIFACDLFPYTTVTGLMTDSHLPKYSQKDSV